MSYGNKPKIPVRNVYYLLCYAWNQLDEGEIVNVGTDDSQEMADLFARVLISGTNHLLRRGLERGYESQQEDLSTLRGKILVANSARRMLMTQGRAECEYDEFTTNTLSNQIIKSTVRLLLNLQNLSADNKRGLKNLYRSFNQVDDIRPSKFLFRTIQLNSNNRFYRFLLNICELVQMNCLLDESNGVYKFKDFIKDDRAMARLYESFILNFYKRETPHIDAKSEMVKWEAHSPTDPELRILPSMKTDISLRSGLKTLIIDAKFYSKTLQSFHDKKSIHSANIYQMLAYLNNIKARGGIDRDAEGLLLYPVISQSVDESYKLNGHVIHIKTIDLSDSWQNIKDQLIQIASVL